MSSFLTLPPEVVDSIIDHTRADLALLKTCSLVCKSWFPAARYHLFSWTRLTAENIPSFIPLIKDQTSTINPYVQHVEAEDRSEDCRWTDNFFTSLTLLPCVTSISFTASCDTPLSQSTLSTLPFFGRLVKLSLAECIFESFSDLQRLICSFPYLEYLYLEADWPQPNAIVQTEYSPSTHLHELHLRCEMSHVLEWFLAQPRISPVSTLSLHGLDVPDLPIVGQYLKTLGPELTYLTIVPFRSIYDVISNCIDLSFNTSLQHLKFATDCDTSDLQMVHAILSQVDSPTFDEVEMSFGIVRQGSKVDNQWTDLDAMLSSRYPRMKNITIAAFTGTNLAKDCLPLCDKRGIVHVRRS